jgi:DNA modification methylase
MEKAHFCHWTILHGDAWRLATTRPPHLPRARAVVTSPPYWRQRVYDEASAGEFGHEATPTAYAARLAALFVALDPWLEPDAAAWVNLGDVFVDDALQLVPAVAALALAAVGWSVRAEVIFERENFTPRPSPGRPQRSHEHVYLVTRTRAYVYDDAYMREPAKYAGYEYIRTGARADDGRLRMDGHTVVGPTRILRSVWRGPTGWNGKVKHPAVMPRLMAERCVLSVTRPGEFVLDPFAGSGTTGILALEHGRSFVGFERVARWASLARGRLAEVAPLFATEAAQPKKGKEQQ